MEMQQPPSAPVAPIEPMPSKKPAARVSKGFYLGSYIGCAVAEFVLAIIVGIAAVIAVFSTASVTTSNGDFESFTGPIWAGLGTVIVAVVLLGLIEIYFYVIKSMLVYKAWKAIDDGKQRTSPGKAVGFLYIPFFNFYWWFPAIWGFSKDYNAYLDRYGMNRKKLSEGLYLTVAILNVAALVFPITGTVNLILEGILVSNTCDAINSIV